MKKRNMKKEAGLFFQAQNTVGASDVKINIH